MEGEGEEEEEEEEEAMSQAAPAKKFRQGLYPELDFGDKLLWRSIFLAPYDGASLSVRRF